ncbi:MAG TPA: Calx-beta domain-containing protein, partial [Mycobacteriales bacterium]|nr:Calx-beta domain-containing protein [Mycobacteriales bacterium]
SVPLLDDIALDGVKTVDLRLGTPNAPNVLLGAQQTSTITIIDNESGSVKFAQAASSVVEGGTAKIAVTRTGTNLQAGIEITYTVIGGTATSDDYTILGTGTLSFARGQTMQTITVQTTPDTIAEPSETVIIQLGNPQGLALLVAPTTHTLTIIDNDTPGVVHFATSALSVPEPQGAAREILLTVMRDGTNLASGVTVDYAVTGGNATSADFTLLGTGTLTFDALQASQPIRLLIQPDDVPEGNETIVVTLSNPTGRATLGSPSVMTITIVDDDRAVYFASDGMTLSETTPSATITLLRSGPPAGAFTVPVTIGGSSTAVAGLDYPATFTGVTARFNSGQTSSTVVIPLLNDAVLDGPRNLVLALGTPVPVAPAVDAPGVGTRRTMTLVLGDNDTPGQIGFAAAASTVNEGATVRIVVSRTGLNLARDVTVDYGVALTATPPTATAGVDFTGGSGTLTFGPGATSAIIEIPALPDGVKGPAKTFTLQLSNPSSGATVIPARTFHVVTIRDTTQAGVIQWMPTAVTANENGGAVTLTIQRTGTNLAQDISVSYALDSINRGTATPDVDYTFAAGTVTFGAGETTKTVTLTPLSDALPEPTETIRITLHSPTGGATLGANKTMVVNLVNQP